MPLSWNEIKDRALAFSRDWAHVESEDAEAKSFWDAFFNVFGVSRRRVANFEQRVKKIDGKDDYIDLLWKGVVLIEHKSRGKDLDRAYQQARDYFPGLKPLSDEGTTLDSGVRRNDGKDIRCAFVSINSITQGEQVGVLWPELLRLGMKIHFAHRTFQWRNEARGVAAVHCVIIGLGREDRPDKVIFDYDDIRGEPHAVSARNINPYLVDAPDIVLRNRERPICEVPEIGIGNKPIDGGHYLFTPEGKDALRAAITTPPASSTTTSPGPWTPPTSTSKPSRKPRRTCSTHGRNFQAAPSPTSTTP